MADRLKGPNRLAKLNARLSMLNSDIHSALRLAYCARGQPGSSIVQRLHQIVEPAIDLPHHIVVGDEHLV